MSKKPDGFFDALVKLQSAESTAKNQGADPFHSGLGPNTGFGPTYDNAVKDTYEQAKAAASQKQTSGPTPYYGDSGSSSSSSKTGESKGCVVSAMFGAWLVFGIFVAPNVFVWLGALAILYVLMWGTRDT